MSAPVRIQRRRTAGWRMPEGAVYVGRPTKWGNPFGVGTEVTIAGRQVTDGLLFDFGCALTLDQAVELYRVLMVGRITLYSDDPEDVEYVTVNRTLLDREIRGRDLVCWCPLDQPCHADVLLEIANGARP